MRFFFIAVLLGLFVVGCGEKALDPGGPLEGVIGDSGANPAAIDAAGGHGRPDHTLKGTMLIASKGGVIALDPKDGESYLFHPLGSHTSKIEVQGTRIFWLGGRDILEFDHLGNTLATIELPDRIEYGLDFTALPDGNFAVHDCKVDSVYFVDPAGAVFQAVAMPDSSPSLQNTRGLVLDGRLIISETGTKKIMQIDLETYTATIFRDFSTGPPYMWFNNIEYKGPFYYIGRPQMLQRFTETGDLRDVADFGENYNLAGFAILKHKAYAAFNHAGKVCEVNLSSGKIEWLLDGLDYPTDVEFIPVTLEPPAAYRLGPHGDG
jgi:hypothetical protein